MSLPPNIRVLAKAAFPTSVTGAGYIVVSKAAGIWKIIQDWTTLGVVTTIANAMQKQVVTYDTVTKQYLRIAVSDLLSFGNAVVEQAGGGSIALAAGTATLAITGTGLTATTVNLPDVTQQNGLPIKIVDWSDNVVQHTINLVPNGAQKVMKLSSYPIVSNASGNTGATLYPSTTLNGWYIAP